MHLLAVDDEKIALAALADTLHEVLPDAEIHAFRSGAEALRCSEKVRIDVAFLDIAIRDLCGLELAMQLQQRWEKTNIIFATGHTDYALDAMNLYASGYLLKPVTPEQIRKSMNHLRHPIVLPESGKLHVQCFGNFEVFSNGAPLIFSRKRSKELLAYLIDRCGASSSVAELADMLWDDGQYDVSRRNQVHSFLSDLSKTLEAAGAGDVLIRQYNSYAVNPSRIDCDFYRVLGNDPTAINLYNGEYMAQYSWAEFTAGALTDKLL